jgi:hypothetical protein
VRFSTEANDPNTLSNMERNMWRPSSLLAMLAFSFSLLLLVVLNFLLSAQGGWSQAFKFRWFRSRLMSQVSNLTLPEVSMALGASPALATGLGLLGYTGDVD